MKRLVLVALTALAVFAPMSADAAPISVGHSGWYWGNPQPQGNKLGVVEFKGSLGFAGGNFGTLLRTDDGGASWTAVPTNTTSSLTHIGIADANTMRAVGGRCDGVRSTDGGQTVDGVLLFQPVCGGIPVAALTSPSPDNSYLLYTTGLLYQLPEDPGSPQTFVQRGSIPGTAATSPSTAPSPDTATDLYYTDSSTGFAVTRGSAGGAIYRTTDGGGTWFQRATSPQGLNGIYFPSAGTGYAVGVGNTVLKTTDGGETWNPKPVPDTIPPGELMSVRCSTASTCLITTENGERVVRTTDGGDSYTSFSPAAEKIFAVSFSGPSRAVGVGEHGAMVISTNVNASSPSFVPVADQPLTGSFGRLRAGSDSLVFAPGESGRLARSTDGGRHWRTNQSPTSENLRDVWFVDNETGFALDAGGGVFRTTDGGGGWSALGTGTDVHPNALYAVDQNVVLLFGPKGVRRATSGTDPSFDLVESKAANAATLTDYDRTDGDAIFAYGRKALIVSRDGGASWKAVRPPTRNPNYRRVDFITGSLGFALLESGRLFRTSNGGKAWREVLSTGKTNVYDLSFGDAQNGFLSSAPFARSGPGAWVLHTSDGGATWRPQLLGRHPLDQGGLVASDGNAAFALAAGSELFFTGTGGDQAPTPSTLRITPRRTVIHHPRTVTIDGKLSPATDSAVILLARNNTTHRWRVFGAGDVRADGTFKIVGRVTQTTQFVAQWAGNSTVNGAGSRVVTIRKR